ncbi:MAG: ArnT family glycosyltransferase [Bacteroidota bacterium]
MKSKLASIAPPAFVVFAFLFSRWLYLRAGLNFDNTPPRYYYQFIDPELLKNRLWESLWYLHGQPPLFNLLTGLLYQLFSPQSKVYQFLFLALGLAFALVIYWLGIRLRLRPWLSALLTVWFMVSPATVLYENLYFYTYVVAFLLVLSALTLGKFLETDRVWWGLGFAFSIAGLCLTWAIFHLFWMIAVIALVAAFHPDRRRLVLISIIPVLLVAGWYSKNYYLFGSFGASSWAGMNLSHITFLSPITPQSTRDELIAQGKLSPYPVREAFRSIDDYQGSMPLPPRRGIAVLDESLKSTGAVNFNHIFYVALSKQMAAEALSFMRSHPGLYLASVKQGFQIYFHASSDYLLFKERPTLGLESWWDRIFYGQLRTYEGDYTRRWQNDPGYVGWWLVLSYLTAVIYGLKVTFSQSRYGRDPAGVVAFMTFTIIYFTFMANFLDIGENNRFRFALDPLVLLLVGMLLQNFIRYLQKRRSQV